MIRKTLGILAVSTLCITGCGDKPASTQPALPTPFATPGPTPTPPSLVPVVTSVEPYYFDGWIIRGSHLVPHPIPTFESGSSVVELGVVETSVQDDSVVVTVPPGAALGTYTPCVQTIHGKGCGSFLVTLK